MIIADFNRKTIDSIREQGMYGVLIEVGAGCPVYNELCQYPNTASRIVKYAKSPNSWKYNNKQYGTSDMRAVSSSVCDNFIYYTETEELMEREREETNFTLVNSIQVANDDKTQCHGWFGLSYKNTTKYYHFTIHGKSRKDQLEYIAMIGLDILNSGNDSSKLKSGFIDIILDYEHKPLRRDLLESILNAEMNRHLIHDNYVMFMPDGDVVRFNDVLRKLKGELTLFKGSFNPIHSQHIEMTKELHRCVDTEVILQISVQNRDENKNKDITVDNLKARIELLNELGYMVCVNFFGLYHYALTTTHGYVDFAEEHKLSFLLGEDIMIRFLEDENKFPADFKRYFQNKWGTCNFYCYLRPEYDIKLTHDFDFIKFIGNDDSDISSTILREKIKQNDFSAIQELTESQELTRLIKKYYGEPE
jgi:nicotinic acid mononucleotide adenylyltransferase